MPPTFSSEVEEWLTKARVMSMEYCHLSLTPLHVGKALFELNSTSPGFGLLTGLKKSLKASLADLATKDDEWDSEFTIPYSKSTKWIIKEAKGLASQEKVSIVEIRHMMTALLRDKTISTLYTHDLMERDSKLIESLKMTTKVGKWIPKRFIHSTLTTYGRDLSCFEDDRIPLIGQQRELERTIHILSQSRRNSVLLVGEAGVGKRTLVMELARRIQDRTVPSTLQYHRVIN